MTMTPTPWSKELETGLIWQDFQHRELVINLHRLYKAILEKRDQESVREIVHFLDIYVKSHFGLEEQYMRAHGYPETEQHLKEHDAFRASYRGLKVFYEEPSELSGTMLCYDLNEWVVNHIQTTDRRLGEFLARQGGGG